MDADPDPSTLGPARRRPGRPRVLSRELVAQAAIDVGFEDLSLAAVARRLGVRHPSLYRYVADRDDLVAAALDLLFAEHAWPPASGGWRQFLEAEGWARWKLLSAHPGIVAMVRDLRVPPRQPIARFQTAVDHLMADGLAPRLAVLAVDSVYALTLDQAGRAASSRPATSRPPASRASTAPAGLPLSGAVAEAVASGPGGDPEAWFGEKLELLLDGVATRVRAARRGRRGTG